MKIVTTLTLVLALSQIEIYAHEWSHHKTKAPVAHHDEYLSVSEAKALGIEISRTKIENGLIQVEVKAPAWITGLNVFDAGVFAEAQCPLEGRQDWNRDYDDNDMSTDLSYTYKISEDCDELNGLHFIYGHAENFHFFWISAQGD